MVIATAPSTFSFGDPRQERIYRFLGPVGPGPAAFCRDACWMMSEANPLESSTNLVRIFLERSRAASKMYWKPLSHRSQFQKVCGYRFLSLRVQCVCRLVCDGPIPLVPMNRVADLWDRNFLADLHRIGMWWKSTAIVVFNSSRHRQLPPNRAGFYD